MSNHHRGLWGYWGVTTEGGELTVQATGIGGPSAVTVLGELAELGMQRAIRIGTCAIPGDELSLGSRLVVTSAIAEDGCSRALGIPAGAAVEPDAVLTTRLIGSTGAPGATVVSRDLQPTRSATRGELEDPDMANNRNSFPADLQTAATLAFGAQRDLAVAATLALASSDGRRLEDEPLEAALLTLAASAAEVLARTRPSSSSSG